MINKKGVCIVCDAVMQVPGDTQETEVITCGECKSRLVVDKITPKVVMLSKAPEVEEDWGE